MIPFELQEKRKFRRIPLSKNDGIYCIVVRAQSSGKPITVSAVDFSKSGFKFSIVPSMRADFSKGSTLYLKAIAGSRNLTFSEPIELVVRWQNHDKEKSIVHIGCEICKIATQAEKQFIQFIHSEVKFTGMWRGGRFIAMSHTIDTDKDTAKQKESKKEHRKRILSIFGGPRENGNTATILGWVEEELKNLKHSVERVDLSSKSINGCIGCLQCKNNPDRPGCVQEDDAAEIIDKMVASDVVIYASPLYHMGFSAQMKAFIDRCYCLYRGRCYASEHFSYVDGQHQALIVTAQDSFENNAEQILATFQKMLVCNKAQSAGELFICNCSTPDKIHPDIKSQAVRFARQLFGVPQTPYSILIPGAVPEILVRRK